MLPVYTSGSLCIRFFMHPIVDYLFKKKTVTVCRPWPLFQRGAGGKQLLLFLVQNLIVYIIY